MKWLAFSSGEDGIRSMKLFCSSMIALIVSVLALNAQSILFVGNSFTFVPKEYGAGTVNDLHGGKTGGIPAIFKQLANEAGKDPQVSSELSGGKTLEWHFKNHAQTIDQSWDIVVLQEYSSRPLVSPAGGGKATNREAFLEYGKKLVDLVREKNPEVNIYFYETWGRPNLVLSEKFEKITDMQSELRDGYAQAVEENQATGLFPVGDAFMQAVSRGISDDPSTPEQEGEICVWGPDKYHQSKYGAYLSALIMVRTIYGIDTRELSVGEDSPVAGLKLDPKAARALQKLAYDLVPVEEPADTNVFMEQTKEL